MILAALPLPAAAQGTGDDGLRHFGDWAIDCTPDDACIMFQRIIAVETETPVFAWRISADGDGRLIAVLRTPLGLELKKGVTVQVDEGQTYAIQYHTCYPVACEARAAMSGPLLDEMKAGTLAQVAMRRVDGVDIKVGLSLKGFTAAFEALNGAAN